jgi:hypothetical protein
MGSVNPYIAKIQVPDTDLGVLDLVHSLVPEDADPSKVLRAVERLLPYRGYTVEKSLVKETIAEALDVYVHQIGAGGDRHHIHRLGLQHERPGEGGSGGADR